MDALHIYDMIVVGGGPAGYSAALYAARAGLDVLVLEKLTPGGQMALTWQIDNYPGFAASVEGMTLADEMQKQAERFGARTQFAEVQQLHLAQDPKLLETDAGHFAARTVVLATGAEPRTLGVPDEDKLIGRGVAYCAHCDGMFYRDKTVAVIGGGNTAAEDALLLSRIARQVILVHRRDRLRATQVYHAPLEQAENIRFAWNSTVEALLHDTHLTGLRLRDVQTGALREIACDGVFVSVGRKPATALLHGQLPLDDAGYLVADESCRTALPGVFAVGDVRTKPVRQVVTAVADGAVAVHMAEQYLAGTA